MDEVWKDIEGYDGVYQVSSLGRFRSKARNKDTFQPLKCIKNKHGYDLIRLYKNKKGLTDYAHRIVMVTFKGEQSCPHCGTKLEINHIDNNVSNNTLNNLEYVTRPTNIKLGHEFNQKTKGWRYQPKLHEKVD